MDPDFITPKPHEEAAKIISGKPMVVKRVFNELLPEIKARAFTVSGIESANALQRIRDAVAAVPLGDQTWDESKAQIVDELEPFLGDGADYRAELVLRTNGFQAFSSSVHRVGMEDDDTVAFQYLHGECAVPTPSHLALNGIVVPKDDPFWLTHTGPWGHLGCVCYKRPMNPDLVADERAKDAKRNPEDQNVIEGAALKQLHSDTIQRGNVRYNIAIDGPDNSGFKWHPDDLRIPIKDLEAKYDPQTWSDFQHWAQGTMLDKDRSVWDWLSTTTAAPVARAATAVAKVASSAMDAIVAKFKAAKLSKPVLDTVAALPPAVAPLLSTMNIDVKRGRANYRRDTKTISIQKGPDTWSGHPDTVVHEIGHHLHYESGAITSTHTDQQFVAAAHQDWKAFGDWAAKKFGADWRTKLTKYHAVESIGKALGYTEDFSKLPLEAKKRIGRWADMVMGLSHGDYGFGHSKSYMQANGLKEVFTHAWGAIIDNDQEFVKLFSGTADEVRRILKL